MAVGLHDLAHSETPAELEKLLVLVRGVDQQGIAAQAAAHHEDVVVQRPDDHLVNLDLLVLVVHGASSCALLPGPAGPASSRGSIWRQSRVRFGGDPR